MCETALEVPGLHSSWQFRAGILTAKSGLRFNRGIGIKAGVLHPVEF